MAGKRLADWMRRLAAWLALIAGVCAIAIAAKAAHPRRHTPRPHRATPSATPSSTPTVSLTPLVLITSGTGTITVPTGTSSVVLDTAEVYEIAVGYFLPVAAMTVHRDRHGATVLRDGRVLIAGGANAVLVPLILFPGPAMPWILDSTEVFDPSSGASRQVAQWQQHAMIQP